MAVTIRPIDVDEHERWTAVKHLVYGEPRPTADVLAYDRRTFEPARTLAAFDGDDLVGTAATATLQLSVPGGGALPMGGLRAVSVLPTHRRRGILTTLMDHAMAASRERGEVLMGLWASEAPIYRRFGFGPATFLERWTIRRGHGAFAGPVPAASIRILPDDPEAVMLAVAPIHDEVRQTRAGMIARDHRWWGRRLDDHGRASVWAVANVPGGGSAYAGWQVRASWNPAGPDNTISIVELVATAPGAYAAMARFVLDIDLVTTVRATFQPPDDPLRWLLADSRRLERQPSDALWLRPVDLPAAFRGRRYRAPGTLVLAVEDRLCPWNTGRWRLEAGADGTATCTPAPTDAPDLTLDAAAVGSLLLGGVAATDLVAAGRIEETRPGAAPQADVLFGWRPLPWCPTYF